MAQSTITVLQVGKFYPPRWGGMETALKDICETTHHRIGLRVAVASESRLARREILSGIDVTRLSNLGTLFSQPLTPGLFSLLRATKADLVHIHEPNPLAMAAFLASGCRSRLVVHYHSDIVRQRRLKLIYQPILRAGLRRAEAIVVGSRELLDSSRVLAPFRSKCRVIPFGIDLEPFLGIQPHHGPSLPLILAVGRLTYYKGFHHLVEAMQGLRAQLVIVGEGEQRGFLETQIAGLGLADRVTLAGRLDTPQLLDWYARASLFCLPSCHASEAFGLVMVEAMASGLPVVSTDLPTGVRAVNAHGETGFVVKAGDAGALRQALRQLIADAGLRRRMGLEGRQRAIDLFSRERMGEQILKLYDAVLRQPAPAVLPLTDGEEVSA